MAPTETQQFESVVCEGAPRRFVKVLAADARPDGEVAVVLALLNPGEPSEMCATCLCERRGGEWQELQESADGVQGVWEYSDSDWVACLAGHAEGETVEVVFGDRRATFPVHDGWFQAVFWPEPPGAPPVGVLPVVS